MFIYVLCWEKEKKKILGLSKIMAATVYGKQIESIFIYIFNKAYDIHKLKKITVQNVFLSSPFCMSIFNKEVYQMIDFIYDIISFRSVEGSNIFSIYNSILKTIHFPVWYEEDGKLLLKILLCKIIKILLVLIDVLLKNLKRYCIISFMDLSMQFLFQYSFCFRRLRI